MKTLKQAASILGVKSKTLYQRVFRGTLKTEKIGMQHFLTDQQVHDIGLKKLEKKEIERK